MTRLDIDEATTWLELAGCVSRLPVTALLQRLRGGDGALVDAVHAILATDHRPSERLDALRDFVIHQCLGETADLKTDAPVSWDPESSPFQVPERYIDAWFRPKPQRRDDPPIEPLMRIRQFYDCLDITDEHHSSTRLFGNSNIGNVRRTNLQVPGQLVSDDTMLITTWWIRTTTWPRVEEFFARCVLTMTVDSRPEMITPGLELLRRRQSLLVPVPARCQFSVVLDYFAGSDEWNLRPEYPAPVYVFVEGWGRRRMM